ncbi:MAG: phosphotransferase, partial [Acidobacteria bacterium]|nr:phosphotransferase [Acidobacteriota bacterium]
MIIKRDDRGGADAAALGSELGAFIGRLHGVSYGRDDLARDYSNRGIQRTRLDVQYRSVDAWLTAHGVGASEAAACAVRTRSLGERLLDPGMCLVMGDLWPPSVRVAAGAIRVIDWEFAHYGQPLQDIAHFAAHAFLHAAERERARQSELLARRTLQAQEQERTRIARELHDTVAQDITAIRIEVERLGARPLARADRGDIAALEARCASLQRTIRDVLLDLRLSLIESAGFIPAARWAVERA